MLQQITGNGPTGPVTTTVQDCYATSAVSGFNNLGGFAGAISGMNYNGYNFSFAVNRTFSTGVVTAGSSPSGGWLGGTLGTLATVSNSIWDMSASTESTSYGGAGVVGEATSAMQGATASTNLFATTLGFSINNTVYVPSVASGNTWKWTSATAAYPVLDFATTAPGAWQWPAWAAGGNPVLSWQKGYGY
jgi:hypothetical protein